MSKKQCQMQPYRAATVADTDGIPTDIEAQAFLLETFGFDGVRFNYMFVCDGDASAHLAVWFYDAQNQMWTPDAEQSRDLGDQGSGTFRIETQGRPMLFKISTLELPAPGAPPAPPPHLLITQGAYRDSNV